MSPSEKSTRNQPVPPSINQIGIWAFESKHDDAFFMKRSAHPFLELLFIREGRGRIETDAHIALCSSGDLVVIPPLQQHRIIDDPTSPISLYGLGVDLRWLRPIPDSLSLFRAGIYASSQTHHAGIEQKLRRLLYLFDQQDPASQLASIATTLALLSELSFVLSVNPNATTATACITEDVDPLLEKYVDWLNRNFFEPLSIDAGAQASGMSRRTFTSKFKARTGSTWLEYVNRLRVKHAMELLKNTDRKIASIAFQCGFEDLSTFYRTFTKVHGKSPGECRH